MWAVRGDFLGTGCIALARGRAGRDGKKLDRKVGGPRRGWAGMQGARGEAGMGLRRIFEGPAWD